MIACVNLLLSWADTHIWNMEIVLHLSSLFALHEQSCKHFTCICICTGKTSHWLIVLAFQVEVYKVSEVFWILVLDPPTSATSADTSLKTQRKTPKHMTSWFKFQVHQNYNWIWAFQVNMIIFILDMAFRVRPVSDIGQNLQIYAWDF